VIGTQRAALVQAVLEGIPLPATKSDLLAYARLQEPDVTADLEGLPDEEFSRLDEVGELLTLVPAAAKEGAPLPQPESGKPPGGDDYTTPHPRDTGRVRHDAPPSNPPQKAIEQASQRQKKQAAEQG
jgi:ABC-type transporter Mla subunit MlaD